MTPGSMKPRHCYEVKRCGVGWQDIIVVDILEMYLCFTVMAMNRPPSSVDWNLVVSGSSGYTWLSLLQQSLLLQVGSSFDAMSSPLEQKGAFGSRLEQSGSISENGFEQHAREGSSGLTALPSIKTCRKKGLPLESVARILNAALTIKATKACVRDLILRKTKTLHMTDQ